MSDCAECTHGFMRFECPTCIAHDEITALRARLASLEEENRAMREALIGAALLSRAKDGLPCWCMALEHDQTCLRARAALRGKEDGSHG